MRIGLIGLGNMGAGMARNLRAAGFDLTVYDVREEAVAALERARASRGRSPADAAFTLELALKDLSLATELAREVDVPVPVAGLVEQMVREGLERGWGQLDNNVVVRLQEEAAGAPVRAPSIDLARAARFITTHPEA
jgi:3-hydroxyisobutyrate dehydrogenase-like beta-hydroxyacid dehydrogenase